MYQTDGIWNVKFFLNKKPRNQEENLDPHEPKALLLVTPGNQEYAG